MSTTLIKNGHFPRQSGYAGEECFHSLILFQLRMIEVLVTTRAISRAKLQSNRHHQKTNTKLFTGQVSFLLPNQQCRNTEGKSITFHGLAPHQRLLVTLEWGCEPSPQLFENIKILISKILSV